MYIENKIRPRIEPWGTPYSRLEGDEAEPQIDTGKVLSGK